MIDYNQQELDRLENPGVPDDIKYLGGGLANVAHWTHKVYDALRRQESPNPTILNLNPGIVHSMTAKMRAYALVFSGGTGGEVFGIKVGSAVAWDFIVPASPAPFTIPLPIVFDAGADVQVVDQTTPSAVNWRCRVLCYVELEDQP